MENKQLKVEKICMEGYDIEFGTVLENAFNNYKLIAATGGLGMILICIVMVIIYAGVFGAVYGFSDILTSLASMQPELMSGTSLLLLLLFTVVMAGIMSPIYAGFINMAFLADQNKKFGLDTLFSYFKGPYFKELFTASVIIAFFGSGLNYLFDYLGIKFIGLLITIIVSFLTFLTIPLIIFSDIKAIEAITLSAKLVVKQPSILLGLLIVSIVLVCLGIIGLCIGVFFTIPFLYAMYYSIYSAILPFNEESELDEIGLDQE